MRLAADLRTAVLQAAFKGELTQRVDGDTPILETLKLIHIEKDKLIAKGKIKTERPLPKITSQLLPDNGRAAGRCAPQKAGPARPHWRRGLHPQT